MDYVFFPQLGNEHCVAIKALHTFIESLPDIFS